MATTSGLEAFGTRALQWGLAASSLGLGAIAVARALGNPEPLAAWADGLGAVPLGAPWGIGLGAVLLVVGVLLLVPRTVTPAAWGLAILAAASVVATGAGSLGAIQDLGLLGAALSLVALPARPRGQLPARLARWLDPARPAPRRLAMRAALGLTFLLAGWSKFAQTGWYADLLAAAGGVAGWPLVGDGRPTAALLWLGAAELLLSVLLVYGPPARLASALAAVLLVLDLLALHTPSLLAVKALGLLGAAIAGYCWASGIRQLADTSIGWLRTPDAPAPPSNRSSGGSQ